MGRDRSGALDFDEFAALLKDMDADKAVAQSRMLVYSLPPSLLKEFSKEAVEEMRLTFGMFDESGDGALDEEELGSLLRTFGQHPTKEKVSVCVQGTKLVSSKRKLLFRFGSRCVHGAGFLELLQDVEFVHVQHDTVYRFLLFASRYQGRLYEISQWDWAIDAETS